MMLKRFLAIGIVAVMMGICGQPLAFSAQKGASETAYKHANDQAIFNRVSDWVAKLGKPD